MDNCKKLYYKLARNNKSMSIENQEVLSLDLKKGDIVYLITKRGIEKDILKKKRIYTEKSLYLVCKKHKFCAKDIGYTVFGTKKEAKKRLKKLKPYVNNKLLKSNKLDLTDAYQMAKIAENHVENYSKELDKLEKKYPVAEYNWEFDPNDQIVRLEKSYNYDQHNKSLERQINCVNDKHMLVKLSGTIYWCQNCGTIIKTKKQLESSKRNPFNKIEKDKEEIYYPMSPHFLPKKN